jgi:hypothetical protein
LHNFLQKKLAFRRWMCQAARICTGLDQEFVQGLTPIEREGTPDDLPSLASS